MKLFATLLAVLATLQLCSGWVLKVNGIEQRGGAPIDEIFYSRNAENDCHKFSSTIRKKGIHDFRFCTIQAYGCEIAFYSDTLCGGKNLGSNGGRGYSWKKNPVSKAGSKMSSFRITGCRENPLGGWAQWDTFQIKDC